DILLETQNSSYHCSKQFTFYIIWPFWIYLTSQPILFVPVECPTPGATLTPPVMFSSVLLAKSSSTSPVCLDGWVGYQRKCYYFSGTEGNWSYCQSSCSSLDASLVWIDSEKEMVRDSIIAEYWPWPGVTAAIELGEQGQPWKWTNGSAFNHHL
uniref:C-type lectin domain-containing protein n=1 Tax=Pelusios castaneus TaxID=367368 RepID=A0A8C8RFH1_9SAUR